MFRPLQSLVSMLLPPTLLAALILPGCSGGGATVDAISEEVVRHNILGTAYLGQQKWTEAQTEFRRALELHPGDPLLLTNVAVALIQRGEIDEATARLGEALASDPDYAYAHYNLGLIQNQNGRFDEAVKHFEVVAAHDPQDLFTRYYLGSTLSRVGREDEAVEAFRAALERDPSHVSSLYGLGRLLLQRGDQDEGVRLITLSQEIRDRSGLDEAVGGRYGEQGPYALGIDYPGGALEAPEPIEVRFEVASTRELQGAPSAWTLVRSDERTEMLLAGGGEIRRIGLREPGGVAWSSGPESRIAALASGDLDGDGTLELVALTISGTDRATLRPVVLVPGAGGTWVAADGVELAGNTGATVDPAAAAGLTLVDRDHDGDLDIFWCFSGKGATPAGCRLATNDGNGTLDSRETSEHGFSLPADVAAPIGVMLSDVDNDRDIDLLVGSASGAWLFSNQRDGTFEDASARAGLGRLDEPAFPLAVADLDKNGWMDLVLGPEARLRTNHHGRFDPPSALAETPTETSGPPGLVVFDLDNDGFLDVARTGSVLRNRGAGTWRREDKLLGDAASATPLAAWDADGDGDLDLAVGTAGAARLLRNEGGNGYNWVALDSRGVGDTTYGIGAKVEVLAGALRQKFEVTSPLPVHAGLGKRESIESARYLWPSGVLQDEVELAANAPLEIKQLDRKGTSCPLLYAWRDGGWRFVTDFLGGSAVGYLHAPGVYSTPDTDEYVRIDGGLTADRDGRLRVRLNNQLEEVIWFDQAELIVVDHPAGTEVYPNERLMPAPPFPEFELFASADVRPIASATDVSSGRDVTDRLQQADRRYVDGFELLRPKGYAEWHELEIDAGSLPAGRRIVLLLDGWIDYADSSANLAASQARLKLIPPRLHVADGRGGWREIHGRMGFPAGLPKTMAVELTGRFPSPVHRLRIGTNMRIYWDRARVMVGGEGLDLSVRRLRPEGAELGFGGFPQTVSPDGKKPRAYDPDVVEATAPWKAHVGTYTAFGDVTGLLGDVDDRLVTTRSGDEIVLTFEAPSGPAPGHERTYLLYANGFGKDMDPNSAAANTVGPIPFHGMPTYPYGFGVVPPVTHAAEAGRPGRRVIDDTRGLPGALPQALVTRAESAR